MSGLRNHLIMGLVLLMWALTDHCSESAPSTAPAVAAAAGGDAQQDLRRMVEIVKHVEGNRGRHGHSAKSEAPSTSRARTSPKEKKDFRNLKTDRGNQVVDVFPRDVKGKFLIYLTGPLYFSPKCRKNAYRVYHHTRDCTIPAYFKRCARLLTRLAGSPQCTEG
ncbi:aLK and LTK ligand 2a [Embiotoca jacksoni]|uniref:aLK and LTK ligand 2a n=1 Tax=Embiotoca jacksoni TaxID=100190 RepID=UPI0037038080